MVQIIKENRKPSFSEKMNAGLSGVANFGAQIGQQRNQQAAMQQENEAAKRLGIDLSGISNPEMRQKAFESAMKAQTQAQLQNQKQQGKLDIVQGKQDFLSKILGPQTNGTQQNEGFNPLDISDAQIAQASAVDPNLGRSLQHSKDVALREAREERDFKERQKKDSPAYKREEQLTKAQADQDIKYHSELQNRMKKTVLKEESLNRIEKVIKKGVTGKPIDQILENMGLISKTSEGRRELAAEVKNQYTDFKEVAGSQLSGMEFQVLSGAYPNANFSKEANLAIVKNLRIVSDTLKKEHEFSEKLKKENGGKLPEDFQSKVNEKLFDYIESKKQEIHKNTVEILNSQHKIRPGYTLMFEEGNETKPMEIPDSEVDKFLEMGDTLP